MSVSLRSYLLDAVLSTARKILHVHTLTVKVGKNYYFLLVELTQIFRNYHVLMWIAVVKLNDEDETSEVVCYFPLEGSTGKASPEHLFTFGHRLIRFRNASIQIEQSSLFDIGFKFPCELFFVVLLKLFLDDSDDSRDLIVFTFPEQLVHFFVCVVTSVKIHKAFEGCVLLLRFE